MNSTNLKALSLSLSTVFLLGCAHSVFVDSPASGVLPSPVYDYRVRFHTRSDPGTFRAEVTGLNGQQHRIDGDFRPRPLTAGPTYIADNNHPFPEGESQLRVSADFSRRQAFDSTAYTVRFTPPRLMVSFQPPGPPPSPHTTSGSSGGASGGSIGAQSSNTIQERTTKTLYVSTPTAPPRQLTVTAASNSNVISINNAPATPPANQAVTTIPTNGRDATFDVRGISPGQFSILITAPGFQATRINGNVVR
jgi:hypothetical protein